MFCRRFHHVAAYVQIQYPASANEYFFYHLGFERPIRIAFIARQDEIAHAELLDQLVAIRSQQWRARSEARFLVRFATDLGIRCLRLPADARSATLPGHEANAAQVT